MTYIDIVFIIVGLALLVYVTSVLTTNPKKKISEIDFMIESVYVPKSMRKDKK